MDYFGGGDNWVVNLIINLLGYGTVLVPGYFIIKYVRNSGYLDRAGELIH